MQEKTVSAPTPFYPSSDGKPMAETDWHRKLLMELLKHWQPLNVSKPKKTTQ